MTYTVVLTPAAQRDVRKLSELAENPRIPGALKVQGDDLYRVRVGEYRILYTIDDDTVIVTVVRVRDRKNVYR